MVRVLAVVAVPATEFQCNTSKVPVQGLNGYGGRVQKVMRLRFWLMLRPPYLLYSGHPLKPSDLSYSPGQPLPVFTEAYSVQIPKSHLRQPYCEPKAQPHNF